LAVLGGLWMPVSLFPDWMQVIGKCLPSYQLMELLKTFLNEGGINLSATVYLLVFSVVLLLEQAPSIRLAAATAINKVFIIVYS